MRHRPHGPKYLRAKRLRSGGLGYFWAPPTWAVMRGCTVKAEPLGTAYTAAVERCELLNRHFDAWRTGRKTDDFAGFTLDWLFGEYRSSRKYQRLKSRLQYELSLGLVGGYKLSKDPKGRRLGQIPLDKITHATAQKLYDALITRPDGTLRPTHINRVVRHVRAAWNVVAGLHPDHVPAVNPFARLDQERPARGGGVKPATRSQLEAFIQAADALSLTSVGTAALIGFELALREPDIIGRLSWSDWRTDDAPCVVIRHGKTAEEYRQPLESASGDKLYPELEARIAAMPRNGPLIVMQDWHDRAGTFKAHTEHGLRHLARRIRKYAGLPETVSFASFRKGGMTEMGEAGLTDQQIIGLSGHKTRQMVSVYSKATEPLRTGAATQRLAHRQRLKTGTDTGSLSE